MTLSRRIREILIVALLLVVPVLVLRANTRAPQDLNFVDRFVLRVSAPLQSVLAAGAGGVERAFRNYVALAGTKKDNARLAAENARLVAELSQARQEAARSQRLERLLGLRAEVPSETLAARVVGVDTSAFFRVLRVRLDRGEPEVRPGMAVLVAEGVVGRVQRVFGPYCDVTLAVDPRSSIDVVLPRTGGRGVLKGLSGDDAYRAKLDYLLRAEEVHEGDEVVTSGIGGVFPRGLAVGRVSKIVKQDFGLYQDAEVAPSVDFARLDEVLVVLGPPPPPDPDAGSKRATEPHRGLGAPR